MSTQPQPEGLVSCLAQRLAQAGVDVAAPLALSWYNHSIPAELGARIPARGAAGGQALCVLVANSRAVWEPFVEACAREGLLQQDNPLEAYMEDRLCAALAACAPGLPHRVYWSHRRTADLEAAGPEKSEHVAFQRMAHHAGLAYLDETSHLCLHPRFGPWFSLRCVVIFDDIPYMAPRPAELANPLPLATQQYVALALHSAVHNTSRKFRLPEVDVEAAEAVIAEANIEPTSVVDDSDEEEAEGEEAAWEAERQAAARRQQQPGAGLSLGQGVVLPPGPVRCPSSSARSTAGSARSGPSGGTTPACSSGCSSPRAGLEPSSVGLAGQQDVELAGQAFVSTPEPAGPEGFSPRQGAPKAAAPLPVPLPAAPEPAGPAMAASGSPVLQVGSLGSTCSRRSSLDKPSMRAVAANWRAWVAVRDAPCPGHPWRYSEEQLTYHYTRDKRILRKALLRRNLGPQGLAAATGLLDPALSTFHQATMAATSHKSVASRLAGASCGAEPSSEAAGVAPAVPTPGASPAPSAVAAG